MKLDAPYGQLGGGASPQARLDALLALWRPPAARRRRSSQLIDIDEADWRRWEAILRTCRPVTPRTHVDGFRFYLSALGKTIEQAIDSGLAVRRGVRIAIPQFGRLDGERVGGYCWAIRVDPAACGLDISECHATLGRRFRSVVDHGSELVASEPSDDDGGTDALLLTQAHSADEGRIDQLWMIACALGRSTQFLDQLAPRARARLATTLSQRIDEASAVLGLATDLELLGHSEAGDTGRFRTPLVPTVSRADALFYVDMELQNLHRPLGDDYVADLVIAYALAGEVFGAAELLRALPLGRASLAGLDALLFRRSDALSALVAHPSFSAEGAFALRELPSTVHWTQDYHSNMVDEWTEIQGIGRRLILAEACLDWPSAVSLVARDLRDDLPSPGPRRRTRPLFEWRRPWLDACKESGPKIAEALIGRLRSGEDAESTLLLALETLPHFDPIHDASIATRLADATVLAYAQQFGAAAGGNAPRLYTLAAESFKTVKAFATQALWKKWLTPFPIAQYVAQAEARPTEVVHDSTRFSQHTVGNIFLGHLATLAAQAEAEDNPAEAIEAALALMTALFNADGASGSFLAGLTSSTEDHHKASLDAPLVRIGRAAGRLSAGSALIDRLLGARLTAYCWAQIVAGAERGDLADRAERRLAESLASEGVLGGRPFFQERVGFINVLIEAEKLKEAEAAARKLLEVVPPNAGGHYISVSYALLAAALAKQRKWTEVLDLHEKATEADQREFLLNIRAIGLMELGDFAGAGETLNNLLRRNPSNGMGIVNNVARMIRQGEWAAAVDACVAAKPLVGTVHRDTLIKNEAIARNALGDAYTARKLFPGLHVDTQPARTESLVVVEGKPDEAASLAAVRERTTSSQERVDVLIITAIQQEFEAVRSRLAEWETARPEFRDQRYRWTRGVIGGPSGKFRIILACCGEAGNVQSALTTLVSVQVWNPMAVVFAGIAGGIRNKDYSPRPGDLVIGRRLWHYEYGKVLGDRYVARSRDLMPLDKHLADSARQHADDGDWLDVELDPDGKTVDPQVAMGLLLSGEKVIDNVENELVRQVLVTNDDACAVEMEAFGSFSATRELLGAPPPPFVMIRGVSDIPRRSDDGHQPDENTQSETRDKWKEHASNVAASFVVHWIGHGWPKSPCAPQ